MQGPVLLLGRGDACFFSVPPTGMVSWNEHSTSLSPVCSPPYHRRVWRAHRLDRSAGQSHFAGAPVRRQALHQLSHRQWRGRRGGGRISQTIPPRPGMTPSRGFSGTHRHRWHPESRASASPIGRSVTSTPSSPACCNRRADGAPSHRGAGTPLAPPTHAYGIRRKETIRAGRPYPG